MTYREIEGYREKAGDGGIENRERAGDGDRELDREIGGDRRMEG